MNKKDEKEVYLEYEEYKVPPQFWGWVLLILFALSLMGYGMWSHHLIPDPPRFWDHGSLPDTPAESVYSTFVPSPIKTEKRIVGPLPEGRPLEPGNRPTEPGGD
jgi:hypothetical protein